MVFASTSVVAAPYVRADKPITDKDGLVKVIIDFASDAHLKYPGALPVLPERGSREQPKEFFQTEKALALVADYETRYGFKRLGMTSWVGNSVTAYVNSKQIDALRSDPIVQLISDDWESSLSSYPFSPSLAADITVGNEISSWGRSLVNGKSKYPYIDRKIYVIDNGVAYHNDLPNVTRTNVACGSGGGCENVINPNLNGTLYPVTGCFGHATHVAGIIGAVGNGSGTIGAYAGATMVSLNVTVGQAVGSFPNYTASECTVSSPTVTSVGYALDYMYQQVLYSGQLAVANISINSAGLGVKSSATLNPTGLRSKTSPHPPTEAILELITRAYSLLSQRATAHGPCRELDSRMDLHPTPAIGTATVIPLASSPYRGPPTRSMMTASWSWVQFTMLDVTFPARSRFHRPAPTRCQLQTHLTMDAVWIFGLLATTSFRRGIAVRRGGSGYLEHRWLRRMSLRQPPTLRITKDCPLRARLSNAFAAPHHHGETMTCQANQ